ncbi:MetS family NSS transporter small subunit [Vallitalea sediminicola]
MGIDSIIFCAFSLLFLWGGFGVCLRIALKNNKFDN